MGSLYAILRNTLLETVRQPVYGLTLVVACCIILCIPFMSGHVYVFTAGSGMEVPAQRMAADVGLSTVLLMGLILAIHATASVISREIENKTALNVLSKRVGRWAFIFGKFGGVALALVLACATGLVFVLMSIRMGVMVTVSDYFDYGILGAMLGVTLLAVLVATFRNYYRGRAWIGSFTLAFMIATLAVFAFYCTVDRNYRPLFLPPVDFQAAEDPQAYDKGQRQGQTFDWEVAKAGLLTTETVLIMAAVAVAASSRLRAGGNLAVCGAVFVAGLTSQYFLDVTRKWTAELPEAWTILPSMGGQPRVTVFDALYNIYYAFVPNFQHFWMSDALTRESDIPLNYLLYPSVYGLAYAAGVLCLACFLFERREVA